MNCPEAWGPRGRRACRYPELEAYRALEYPQESAEWWRSQILGSLDGPATRARPAAIRLWSDLQRLVPGRRRTA